MEYKTNKYIDEEVLLTYLMYARPNLFLKEEGAKGITLIKDMCPIVSRKEKRGFEYLADLLKELGVKPNKVGRLIKDQSGDYKRKYDKNTTFFSLVNNFNNEDLSDSDGEFFIKDNASSESAQKVKEYINGYIERFTRDELVSDTKKYLTYQKQKELFLRLMLGETPKKKFIGEDIIIEIKGELEGDLSPIHAFSSYEQEGLIKIMQGLKSETKDGITTYSITIKVKKENLEKLERERRKYTDEKIGTRTFYDFKDDILYVRGDKVKTSSDEQRRVLGIIFSNKEKIRGKWSYRSFEIDDEDMDEEKPNTKYKNLFNNLNRRIKEKTGTENFFDVHDKWVKIEERYLA